MPLDALFSSGPDPSEVARSWNRIATPDLMIDAGEVCGRFALRATEVRRILYLAYCGSGGYDHAGERAIDEARGSHSAERVLGWLRVGGSWDTVRNVYACTWVVRRWLIYDMTLRQLDELFGYVGSRFSPIVTDRYRDGLGIHCPGMKSDSAREVYRGIKRRSATHA